MEALSKVVSNEEAPPDGPEPASMDRSVPAPEVGSGGSLLWEWVAYILGMNKDRRRAVVHSLHFITGRRYRTAKHWDQGRRTKRYRSGTVREENLLGRKRGGRQCVENSTTYTENACSPTEVHRSSYTTQGTRTRAHARRHTQRRGHFVGERNNALKFQSSVEGENCTSSVGPSVFRHPCWRLLFDFSAGYRESGQYLGRRDIKMICVTALRKCNV